MISHKATHLFFVLAALFALPLVCTAKPKKKKNKDALPPVKVTATSKVLDQLNLIRIESVRLAMEDLRKTYPQRFRSTTYLAKLAAYERALPGLKRDLKAEKSSAIAKANEVIAGVRKMLLANPALDFKELLIMRRRLKNPRRAMGRDLGHPPLNSHTLDAVKHTGWDNAIIALSNLRGAQKERVLYAPANKVIVTDYDLHWDAGRLMFSSIGTHDRWHLFEIKVDGTGLKQLTPKDLTDVSHFDSCYLADDRIAFTSTAAFQGLPCEYGSKPMAQLYRLDPKTGKIEQLTFEQDSDWTPAMLPSGRLMYLRWEYTDEPHYFTRVLMSMNPDGTDQKALYGSNSYFPNAFFYARPIPGTQEIVGIVGGHHGISRSGRMMVIDPGKGRFEADGVVHEFPHRGRKVEPIILDRLVDKTWPHFTHPYPLNRKYFLAAAKPTPGSLWGIYLVDVFDNMTLIREEEDAALLEPVPLVKTRRPALVPDKVVPGAREATVYLHNVYFGPGLKGVSKGAIKSLRICTYEFAHVGEGGHNSVGIESGWDVKRILGTVPVEKDGSAMFKIPANMPLYLQPLDSEGRAMQLFRSWFTGKPGEFVSCVGCHEDLRQPPPVTRSIASARKPSPIQPWHGPARPFSFLLEVQPVLDRYCVGCHDGKEKDRPNFADRERRQITIKRNATKPFSGAYVALQYYVRRPGPESDYHLLNPMEYHASTSELVQMLKKGHYGVKLDREAWERIYTWIDLNATFRGRWYPHDYKGIDQHAARLKYASLYAGVEADPMAQYDRLYQAAKQKPLPKPVVPKDGDVKYKPMSIKGWPLSGVKAGDAMAIDDSAGGQIKLVRIPAGRFVMGSTTGAPDEGPLAAVTIDKPFYMAVCELTNAQYKAFNPKHDSRYIDMPGKDQKAPGYPANGPTQPVIRVSWERAMAYCRWLSKKTGRKVTLPTEAQWEWACRAGTATPFSFGAESKGFAKYANLADTNIRRFDKAIRGADKKTVVFPDQYILRVNSENDRAWVSTAVGTYAPNAFGLHDMHGNVCEWTRSSYRAYPYRDDDGRNDLSLSDPKAVRGGSWRDRPKRATSSFRLSYGATQQVFNVGFRIIIE